MQSMEVIDSKDFWYIECRNCCLYDKVVTDHLLHGVESESSKDPPVREVE